MKSGKQHGAPAWSRRSVVALLATSAAMPLRAQDRPEIIGEVENLSGNAFVEADGVRRLSPQSEIHLNDQVWTDAGSRLTLRLGEHNRIHLGPGARLVIDRFLAEAGGELTLQSGAMVFDRPEDASKTDIEVQTVFGLIGVRGTRFFAGPSNGVFGVFCERGAVSVRAAAIERLLGPGDGVDIEGAGDAPSEVRKWGRARVDAAFAGVLGAS